ncbi:MAG TPA: glutaredoxin family protein [Sporosarcina sp.]|nr:glutaredoxin family protein [Sporosarcina sp.]
MHIVFYRQDGCALCDEAEMMLKLVQEEYAFTWSTIDIRADDAIHEKYMLMVPVIEYEEKVVVYGNIGYVDVVLFMEEHQVQAKK